MRGRAVRLVLHTEGQHASRWQAVRSISTRIGCMPPALNDRVQKADVGSGQRPGVPTHVAERMDAPERENHELRKANEFLRSASACFAVAGVIQPGPWSSFEAVEYERRNGWTGSPTAVSSSQSGTSRRHKPRPTSTPLWNLDPSPRIQPKSASGKPGAVPFPPGRALSSRDHCNANRAAALAERRGLLAS